MIIFEPSCVEQGRSRGRLGRSPPLEPAKITFFTMILNNSENSIRTIRPFCCPLFCHSSVVMYTSSLLQKWTRNVTWLPNVTEISPSKLTGWIRPRCRVLDHATSNVRIKSQLVVESFRISQFSVLAVYIAKHGIV